MSFGDRKILIKVTPLLYTALAYRSAICLDIKKRAQKGLSHNPILHLNDNVNYPTLNIHTTSEGASYKALNIKIFSCHFNFNPPDIVIFFFFFWTWGTVIKGVLMTFQNAHLSFQV
ncbi:hypothetical protein CROQUDRAFT_143728 [Cronartium quercuum f. sp. fusiforme G11]|uniref:Uncharacterized protein n=1 Tax=Cronartium quercuum f. sp. fusiforme G11 TaxID=708437 RepID=A0A9P6NUZ4_9BASI|nr:hypothetical protein CROQUDRAFT_143728 [Cronartium quercuum f. sp. fusiforme G11]